MFLRYLNLVWAQYFLINSKHKELKLSSPLTSLTNRLQVSLPNHGRAGWNAAVCDDSAEVSDPLLIYIIDAVKMVWLAISSPTVIGGFSVGSTAWSASAWGQEHTSSPVLQWVPSSSSSICTLTTLNFSVLLSPLAPFLWHSVLPAIIEDFSPGSLLHRTLKLPI